MNRSIFTAIFILIVILFLAGCLACDQKESDDSTTSDSGPSDNDDDDDDNDDDDNDDNDDDDNDDDDWISPTAWDDFLAAEEQVTLSNFSTAMDYYDRCVLKLRDDEPLNDGPVEPMTLEKAEYGYVLMMTTTPLRIIEYFLAGWLTGADVKEIMEQSLINAGFDTDQQPTSLITVYLKEIIVPLLKVGCERLDHARANESFEYRMPVMRFLFNGSAFEIPSITGNDGLGEHDRSEAHLMAGLYHFITSAALVVTTQNLDTTAARIDDILDILMSGDFSEMLSLLEEFPALLTLHDDEEIDGPALMMEAHIHWMLSFDAFFDDDDKDGAWFTDDNGTPFWIFDDFTDPGEKPDDFYDSWKTESDAQFDDIIGRVATDWVSLNVSINGQPIGTGGILGILLSTILPYLIENVAEDAGSVLMGFYPPESNDANGLDDDIAFGTSTGLSASILTDATASFVPGDLKGFILNPNIDQPAQTEANETFVIVDNSATTISVSGNMTLVAQSGDVYSVGDGWIDDRPIDISWLISLLIGNFVPPGSDLGFYISQFYDEPFNFRDILPIWDEDLGDPSFYNFIVDQSETYTDINGNGQYDYGVDTFTDAGHAFDTYNYPADGFFQPYYFFFPDGYLGGLLTYDGDWKTHDPTDNLNRIVSGILMLIGGVI